MFVGMDRNMEVMEGRSKLVRNGGRLGEVRVQHGGDRSSTPTRILRLSGTRFAPAVLSVIRIGMAITRKGRIGVLAMPSQGMIKKRQLESE